MRRALYLSSESRKAAIPSKSCPLIKTIGHEFDEALDSFISSFELVFDHDWYMTKASIGDDYLIAPSRTFINPGVDDGDNNWANRGSLLSSYRHLRELMTEYTFDTRS